MDECVKVSTVSKIIGTIFLLVFLFQYAQETQHEKILRGLAVGIALTMFNRLEESDALVTSLSTDKDPVLRRSGMYTIAMAYCGTGNNQAIRKLLHVAVSTSLKFNIKAST
jgi:26S proteasome regulatory subunit N2